MYTSREGCAQLADHTQPADGVIINFGLVDTWVTTFPKVYIEAYPDNLVRKHLRKYLKSIKRRLRKPWLRRIIPLGSMVSESEFRENFRAMVNVARKRNPVVRIAAWGTCLTDDLSRNELIERYNTTIADLAQEMEFTYLDTVWLLNSLDRAESHVDGIHLSQAAQRRIANALGPALFGT